MDQLSKLVFKSMLMREPIKAENEQSIIIKPDELNEVLKDKRNIVVEMTELDGIKIRFSTEEENKLAEAKEKREIVRKLFSI